MKLPHSFYLNPNVLEVGKALIGKLLLTKIDGVLTGGYITETESYAGVEDKASHAYGGRKTKRTETMYAEGGVAYVYLCYGMHALLNVVSGKFGVPHAVLIRAIEPVVGVETMQKRRMKKPLISGPGTLTQALGITCTHNGLSYNGDLLWIEEGIKAQSIRATKRIGIDYAGEDAYLPYRFIGTLVKIEL